MGADVSRLARPAEIRQLRAQVSDALFARHEDRVTRLASLSRLLPVPMTAKIAELALGPMLSARVAAALDPREAARLAGHLDAGFLTTLAVSLDPKRVAAIVRGIDDKLVVDVGRRLLAKGEYLVLSRFVSVVDTDVALAVVASATPDALLQVALFTDEPAALDSIVARLSDETLADIIRAAADADAYDAAVTLPLALSTESCSRLVAQVHAVAPQARDALVAAASWRRCWTTSSSAPPEAAHDRQDVTGTAWCAPPSAAASARSGRRCCRATGDPSTRTRRRSRRGGPAGARSCPACDGRR